MLNAQPFLHELREVTLKSSFCEAEAESLLLYSTLHGAFVHLEQQIDISAAFV
jgi:hypothetical protein